MVITYSDLCGALDQSLEKIERDENELKTEFKRFQAEFIAALYMPGFRYEKRSRPAKGPIDEISEHNRVEFHMIEDTTCECEQLKIKELKYHFDVLLHIGRDSLSSEVCATITKRITLQCSTDLFIYSVDYERFAVIKEVESERYDALFYYIKRSLYKQCCY